MLKNENSKDLIVRLGYFRNKRNLSAREVSLRLGHNESWYYRVESGEIDLKLSIVFDLIELFEISPTELFYYDPAKYKEDSELLSIIKTMSADEKETLCRFLKMKK